MIKTLIKKQLLELFQTYYVDKKTGKARTKQGTVLFFCLGVLMFTGLGVVFYGMAKNMAVSILGNGFNWLYFALGGLIAIVLGVFGSVFNTYGSLYLPKDNDLLLSLPIPVRKLIFARICGVYATSLLYSAWVWIPVTVAYWVTVPVTVCNIIFPILLTFIIALFVTILSCVLGLVVALVASKTKGRSFLTVFLSLAVMGLYYVVYFKVINSLNEIVNHLDTLGSTVKSWLHYMYLLGKAADGDVLSMLLITIITVALFTVCFFVLSKTFMKFALTDSGSRKKTNVTVAYTTQSAHTALLRREYTHFISVPTWILNGGFGLLLMPIAAVVLLIKNGSIQEMLVKLSENFPELNAMLPCVLLASCCLFASTGALSPVSVSMEGKSLWIVQSLPIDPWEILHAKENMAVQMTVCPSVLLLLVGGFILHIELWQIAILFVGVWFYSWLSVDFGLFLNLKQPNLTWTNAAYLTKQSMPVVINLFGGWIFSASLGVNGCLLCQKISSETVLAGFIALFFVLWKLLHRWLKTKGTEILMSL